MDFKYRHITIYVTLTGDLIIVPTGNSDRFGIVEIEPVIRLNAPYEDEEIEKAMQAAYDQCFNRKPDDNKETVIERFLKIKGYARAVKNLRVVAFHWSVDEGFTITPTRKIPRQGYDHVVEQTIRLGLYPAKGEIATAIRKGIDLSTIE